jgi:hypothetical protein
MTAFMVEYITKPSKLSSDLLDWLGLQNISRRKRAFNNLFNLGLDRLDRQNEVALPFSIYKDYPGPTYSLANSLFLSFFANVPRDAATVRLVFDQYKELLFSQFDEIAYKRSLAESYTIALLITHKQITADKNYVETFAAIEQQLAKPCSKAEPPEPGCPYDDPRALNLYEAKFGDLPQNMKLLAVYTEDHHQDEMKYWLYSFWHRRLKETNLSEVAAILQEIHRRYNGTAID